METSNFGHFTKKIWTAGGIILFLVISAALFFYTFNLWLLLVAGIVLAVYLRLITNKIKKWTGWKDMVCFIISLLITLLLLSGLSYLIGHRIQEQYQQLESRWPTMKKKAAEYMKDYPIIEKTAGRILGQDSVDEFNDSMNGAQPAASAKNNIKGGTAQSINASNTSEPVAGGQQQNPAQKQPDTANQQKNANGKQAAPSGQSGKGPSDQLTSSVTGFFQSTFGLLGDIYVVLFLGLFLAINPGEYRDGIASLVPWRGKEKARNILNKTGENLGKWFKGMIFSVLITFALTAAGLLAIGQDLWLILAIIAGLLTFIPNFGPIIALIPAALVGLIDSPRMALYIVILYMSVQFVESNIITPMIQKKMLETPPALLLFFQMLIGTAGSGWGIVMATPVLVILITLVQELYLNKNKEETPPEAGKAVSSADSSI